eukprot:SAG31_NODE_27373_length_427_cov_0.631098_1_plen_47_part_01
MCGDRIIQKYVMFYPKINVPNVSDKEATIARVPNIKKIQSDQLRFIV